MNRPSDRADIEKLIEESEMTKKGILLLAAMAVVAVYTAFDWSCTGKRGGKNGFIVRQQERDRETEYRQIADREYFYSAAGAVDACDTFLSHYQYQRCAYCDEVREMRTAFREMGEVLGKNFYSYEQYKTESHYVSQRMAESPYRVVRETWKRLSYEEDSCRLRAALVSLTSRDFSVYLHDYAQQMCQEQYGKGLFAMRVNRLELVQLSQPTLVEGTAAVACTAEYAVHLEGALGLGLRTRTDRMTVSGELGYTPEGRLIFHRKECRTQ